VDRQKIEVIFPKSKWAAKGRDLTTSQWIFAPARSLEYVEFASLGVPAMSLR